MTHSEQLERETESCRNELADTLDELRARMTPGEVVDQLVDYAQNTTGGLFFQNLKQQVASNPLPVALMGAGFAWLMFGKAVSASRLRQGTASVAEKGRAWLSEGAGAGAAARRDAANQLSEAGSASDALGAAAAGGRERIRAGAAAVSDAAAQAKEAMSDATAEVKDTASQVKDTTVRLKDAASAAGAAFGDTVSGTYDRAAARASQAATAVARLRFEHRKECGGEWTGSHGLLPRSAVGFGGNWSSCWRGDRRSVAANGSRRSIHGRY
jgi:Protein of unknown function (DUF3618)